MLVWGSKGEVADLGVQASQHCPTCAAERQFRLMLQYKVHHIWYVFKWVTGKEYALVCEVCHRGEKLKTQEVEAKLGKSPISWYSRWSWAALAALVIGVGVAASIDGSHREQATASYVAAPAKGDVYVMNVSSLLKSPQSSTMYGLMKLREVRGDELVFDTPNVTYSKLKGATRDLSNGRDADASYFGAEPIVLTRADVARLQREGAVHEVRR
ncbi:MAG: hypothetical protein E6Q92_11515 [Burkholderiaceae bacterium]|nr:MAG: hypothetical protein E6Q92_11515 [Burkholderiaceae bacterium]